MSKGAKGHRGFLSEIGLGASQTLAGKSSGGGVQDQLRRSLLSSIVAPRTSQVSPATYDWTFDVNEVGVGPGWESDPYSLAPGGWVISFNITVAELSGGALEDITLGIAVTGRPTVQASGASISYPFRVTSTTTAALGIVAGLGVDFTANVHAGFSKLFDL